MLAQVVATDPIIDLVQYGVLGLVVLGFIFGWIWARPAVQHLIDENEALKQELHTTAKEVKAMRQELEQVRKFIETLAADDRVTRREAFEERTARES